MRNRESFCPVFERLKQLAEKKGLNPENTILNKAFCPFAQACLGLASNPPTYKELIDKCQLFNQDPPYFTIYLKQHGPTPYNSKEAFINRLEKTAKMRGISIE